MEIWDIYDQRNQKTGQTIERSRVQELKVGQYHACVNGLLYDQEGQLLVQQRSFSKETSPGIWDIFTGGSLLAGESPEQAISREVAEELSLHDLDFSYLGYEVRPDIKCIMHYYKALIPEQAKKNLLIQTSEVERIAWIAIEEAERLVEERIFDRKWLKKSF
ncbi:isopentenyldiphosphate isomerase [Streptococcus rupicaprae]|uniref:Isopentenyldiphosphate isomerase n=1 Tax=Streptococcus rupicaprae TaxID=759619 RepID=A0ABV2FH05_9STRE